MNILPRISDTLYHGTIDFFSSVDVTKGRSNKDFGKGFYMAVENLGIQYYIGKQRVADKLILSLKELQFMPESQIETAKGNSTIALTRHIMEKYNLPQDKAFAKLSATEFYDLLNDTGTNLFLETNDYLCKACDFELDGNVDEMYSFIQNN